MKLFLCLQLTAVYCGAYKMHASCYLKLSALSHVGTIDDGSGDFVGCCRQFFVVVVVEVIP